MRSIRISLCFIAFVLLVPMLVSSQGQTTDKPLTPTVEERSLIEDGTVMISPVSGKKIIKKSSTPALVYRNRLYFFCCRKDMKKFINDIDMYSNMVPPPNGIDISLLSEGPVEPKDTKPQPSVQPIKSSPVIKFENPIHDFGQVRQKITHTYDFKFKNIGDSILKIDKVKGSCACIVPKLDKKVYAPGESGIINAFFTAKLTQQGPIAQNIYIYSNDEKNPKYKLTVKADVFVPVIVTPKKLKLLPGNDTTAGPITLTSKDKNLFSVKSISSTKNIITFDFDPNNISDEIILEPKVNLELLKEQLNGKITIQLTHPETKEVVIPFEGNPLFKVLPSSILLRDLEPGQVVRRKISVISNYSDPIEILSVSSEKNHIKVISNQPEQNKVTFELEITPPPKEGKAKYFNDKLKIILKNTNPLAVNCTGIYKE